MRNIARIFADDMRLAFGSIASLLMVIALCLVPALFAWINIAGSWDPYANTDKLKIAVANSDEGYAGEFVPGGVNFGSEVALGLHENNDYGWVFIGEEEAVEGVKSGEYYSAVVIPADFSTKLMTALSTDAENAQLLYYANMKSTPLASASDAEDEALVTEGIRSVLADAIDEASLNVIAKIASVADSDDMQGAVSLLVARLDGVVRSLGSTADQLRAYGKLSKTASSLAVSATNALGGTGNDNNGDAANTAIGAIAEKLGQATSDLRDAVAKFESYLSESADISSSTDVDKSAKQLVSDARSLGETADSIASNTRNVASSLAGTISNLTGSADSLSGQLNSVRKALNKAAKSLDSSADDIDKLSKEIEQAVSSGDLSALASLIGERPATIAQTLTALISVNKQAVYTVEPYGSSKAPFYSVMALWVGAVLLVLVMRTRLSDNRIRALNNPRNYQLFLGRFPVYAVIALLQAVIVWAGDVFFLRMQCANPPALLVACCVCSFVFCCIAYTLVATFGGMGKALCIVLLVMQVTGLGGEYPSQMMGGIFQTLNSLLPFTYGIDAMRECIAGFYAGNYLEDLLKVAAFIVPMLVLVLVLRHPVVLASDYLEKQLEGTGLM